MTENLCALCGRPSPDAYVCRHDALRLADDLREAAGHAEDAPTVIARQARYGGGFRASSEPALPVDLTAGDRYAIAESVITTWARHVDEEGGPALPAGKRAIGPVCAVECQHISCRVIRRPVPQLGLPEVTRWLAGQTGWLSGGPEAKEAFDELGDACAILRRLVDRPTERDLVGVCDCGKVLYAVQGRGIVRCPRPTCGLMWDVERSREILRRALGDKLVTLPEAARLAAYLDPDRTQDGIRKLLGARVGQLVPHGSIVEEPSEDEIADAEAEEREPVPTVIPLYRFGDLAALLAGIQKRKRVKAA